MNKSIQKTINNTFLKLISDLKGDSEIESLFRDLMGQKEYEDLVKKLAIVYWIRKKRPVDVIQNNLGVTKKAIENTNKIIDKKGIKLAIKYMEAEEFANVWSEKIKKVIK